MVNKSEMAPRLNCDPYTIHRYLKIELGEIIPQKSKGIYGSVLDDYKAIIIDKVDTYWDTAMLVFKFTKKKGYKVKYSTVLLLLKVNKATVRFETASDYNHR